jgi:hypothetical protein
MISKQMNSNKSVFDVNGLTLPSAVDIQKFFWLDLNDDVSFAFQNVKNEPEDLTGARRDNSNQNNNNDPSSDGLHS